MGAGTAVGGMVAEAKVVEMVEGELAVATAGVAKAVARREGVKEVVLVADLVAAVTVEGAMAAAAMAAAVTAEEKVAVAMAAVAREAVGMVAEEMAEVVREGVVRAVVMVEAVMVAVATGMRNRRRGAPRPN